MMLQAQLNHDKGQGRRGWYKVGQGPQGKGQGAGRVSSGKEAWLTSGDCLQAPIQGRGLWQPGGQQRSGGEDVPREPVAGSERDSMSL